MRVHDELLEKMDDLIAQDMQTMQENLDEIDKLRNVYDFTESWANNRVVRVIQNLFGKLIRKLCAPVLGQQTEINTRLMCVTMDLERMQKHMEERAVVKAQMGMIGGGFNGYTRDAFEDYRRICLEKRLGEHELYNHNRQQACIIQIVATVNFGDAVGNDAIAIKNMLKKQGIPTAIFAETIHPRVQDEDVIPLCYFPELREEDKVIYHFAAADMNIDILRQLKCKKILRYHNVTPPEFFEPYDKVATEVTRLGLKQIKENRDIFDSVLTDSEFNKKDLQEMGYTCAMDVAPILIPFEDYEKEPDPDVIAKYSDGITNILFVGRGAPNKKIEDVIYAFKEYKKIYDHQARLFLVGNYDEKGAYTKYIKNIIADEKVEDVIFPGHISFAAILAYYKIADIFLCMSEHEGFGVPLVEAMYFDVPIVAYNAAAVPDTLGDAGVLIERKNWKVIAKEVNELCMDQEYRENIIKKECTQLEKFTNKVIGEKIMKSVMR